MGYPAGRVPEETSSGTGLDGTSGMSAAVPAQRDAEIGAEADKNADKNMAARTNLDPTSDPDKVAYAPPRPDAGAVGGSGSQVDAGSAMEPGTPAGARTPVGTAAGQRWHEIQAGFVDDPRGMVTQAAAMVDEAVEGFISATRERQAQVASSWQGRDAGTDELRTALQDYRALASSLTEYPQPI
jgi:hypothetical protein